jgi:hypothetical protein
LAGFRLAGLRDPWISSPLPGALIKTKAPCCWANPMLHNIEAGARNESPGAYWFGESSLQDCLRWLVQIEHWAAKERSSLRPSHEWVETFPLCGLESQFAALAADPVPFVRTICAYWLGRTKRDDDLPLLRELGKDQDSGVRTAAAEALTSLTKALASFSRPEDLPLLRELAKDQHSGVRTAAMEALASFSRPEALPVLRELALVPDDKVAAEAIRKLASLFSHEELETFLNQHDQELCAEALTALDELLYMPEFPETNPAFKHGEGSRERRSRDRDEPESRRKRVEKPLEEYTVAELREIAEREGAEIRSDDTKADIIAAIEARRR